VNKEDIIRKAKQEDEIELIEFIKLAILQEREACANLRKEVALLGKRSTEYEDGFWEGLSKYEELIRARGKHDTR
jgi:hypothetical protein